jgi:hypothetical protein
MFKLPWRDRLLIALHLMMCNYCYCFKKTTPVAA